MTKQECAIIQAYTGVKMLSDEDNEIFYDYIAHLLDKYDLNFKKESIPRFCSLTGKEHERVMKILSEDDFHTLCDSAVDINHLLNDLVDVFAEDDEPTDTENKEHHDECSVCNKCLEDDYAEIAAKLIDDFEKIDEALVTMESYIRDFIMNAGGIK